MNAEEAVVEKMQRKRRLEVLVHLRKGIGEACKSTRLHSHCQILTFNVTCQDVPPNRLPDQCFDPNSGSVLI